MKIGDKVRRKSIHPELTAVVEKVEIINWTDKNGKNRVRTKYIAAFPDVKGHKLMFQGSQINHTVFKCEESDGQLCLSDLFDL